MFLLTCVLLACNKFGDDPTVSEQSLQSTEAAPPRVVPSLTVTPAGPERSNSGIWVGSTYEPTYVNMELKQISPHVYYVEGFAGAPTDFDGFMSNAAVIVTDEGVVVFDSLGTPSLAYLLLSKIREITNKPLVKVVVSHYHADHIYGLQVFKQRGAEIMAPVGATEYLESAESKNRLEERRESLFPWVNESTYLVKPDVLVEKDTRFTLGGLHFIVRVLGATHSNGDMMLYVVQDKVLLAGDLIFEGRLPFISGSQPDNWLLQLKNLRTINISAIVPGHGPASTEPLKVLNFTHDYLQYVQKTMQDAVDDLTPFDDAYLAADWSHYEKLPAFQVNRNNAYYIFLALEQASVNKE